MKKIKTEEGIFAYDYDMKETYNHMIALGENYIAWNLKNGNYDKDPDCKSRLTINELEAIEKTADFENYNEAKLFGYKKHFDWADEAELNKVIKDLYNKKIIK